jgi:hypothetical protein
VFGDECRAVADDDLRTRIIEGAVGDRRQQLAAQADHGFVDLTHHNFTHTVHQHVTERPSVAAADDQHAFDAVARRESRVHEHLVIGELVPRRRLDETVER